MKGFTFQKGWNVDAGGAIWLNSGAKVTIRDCTFADNSSGYQAGAVHARHPGTTALIEDCTFEHNSSQLFGTCTNIQQSSVTYRHCTFRDNSGGESEAGVAANYAEQIVEGCLFVNNHGPVLCGAIWYYNSWGAVRGNTIVGNSSFSGAVYVDQPFEPYPVVIERNVFAGDTAGYGLYLKGSFRPTHTCNLYFGNARGAIFGASLDPTELVADPRFCDPTTGDYGLAAESPAAPSGNSCGSLLGAFPVGCGTTPAQQLLLAMGHASGAAGQTQLQVPLRVARQAVTSGNPAALAGLDFTLSWDPAIVALTDVDVTSTTQGWQLATNATASSVRVSMASAQGLDVSADGVDVLTFLFTLVASDGSTALHLADTRAFDTEVQPIDHVVEDGGISVSCLKGEVVVDGEVNSADAIKTLQFAAQLGEPTPTEACAADMNNDNEITSGDAVLVLRRAVGLPKDLAGPRGVPTVTLRPTADGVVIQATGLTGLQGLVSYDPSTVRYLGVADADALVAAGSTRPGVVSLALAAADAAQIAVQLRFQLIGESATLEFSALRGFGPDGAELALASGGSTVVLSTSRPNPPMTRLLGAAPNPFNPSTRITFALATPGAAVLRIYDGAGRLVRVLRSPALGAGEHALTWDGRDGSGSALASGIYRVRMDGTRVGEVVPITLVK